MPSPRTTPGRPLTSPLEAALVDGFRLLGHPWLWWFLRHPAVGRATAWGIVCSFAFGAGINAWSYYDSRGRRDGNEGHALIDFGGQWVMARLWATGRGRDLYHRSAQREVLEAGYPVADEDPKATAHDVDNFMYWFMGTDDPGANQATASVLLGLGATDPLGLVTAGAIQDDYWHPGLSRKAAVAVRPLAAAGPLDPLLLLGAAREGALHDPLAAAAPPRVGGPLYPPVHPLLFWPLGYLSPHTGYRVNQVMNLGLAFVAGFGVSYLTAGRVWVALATLAVFLFPGFWGSLSLGQNATLTLAILVWGWALAARGRELAGGTVWGLLAFKPVWAMAFFLIPVLTRRWRFGLAMLLTGATLGLMTVPVVGVSGWLEWLAVGREAAATYNSDLNWIFLSRDLLGIPRRFLLDFNAPAYDRVANVPALVLGWGLLLGMAEVTLRVVASRGRRAAALPATGPGAAFLFLSAWLSCFHFMYYDVTLAALGVLMLLTEPRRFLRPRFLFIRLAAPGDFAPGVGRDGPVFRPRPWDSWLVNSVELTLLALLFLLDRVLPRYGLAVSVHASPLAALGVPQPLQFPFKLHGPPWDTWCLIVLWAWCGGRWVLEPDEPRVGQTEEPVATGGRQT